MASWGISTWVSQRWDSGCWALTCSLRAVVLGSPRKRCPALGSPGLPPLQPRDSAGSGLGACWASQGLSTGWPRPVLGNGYSRKLSQPGRHVCGNRKKSGRCSSGGKRELCPAVGSGLAQGAVPPCQSLLILLGATTRRPACCFWAEELTALHGVMSGPWRCGGGWSGFLPILPVLQLCHEVSGLRQSLGSGDGVGVGSVVRLGLQTAWGGESYSHNKCRFSRGLCLWPAGALHPQSTLLVAWVSLCRCGAGWGKPDVRRGRNYFSFWLDFGSGQLEED